MKKLLEPGIGKMNRECDEAPVASGGRNPSASALLNGRIVLDGSRPLAVDGWYERVDAMKPMENVYDKLKMSIDTCSEMPSCSHGRPCVFRRGSEKVPSE
jgi:hypothetical protein